MELATPFFIGLVGSLHCAGMCGVLALALPAAGSGRAAFFGGRAAYNLGRVTTYAALGAVFGLLGRTFVLAGLQRWLSLIAGGVILLGLLGSTHLTVRTPVVKVVAWLKARLSVLLQRRGLSASFALGLLNGLLPCGLVYVACAAAAATGGVTAAMASMFVFGLGTVPMMLAIGLAGQRLQFSFRFKLQRLVPASLALVGALLILRGLALGIPYLSPDLTAAPGDCRSCH